MAHEKQLIEFYSPQASWSSYILVVERPIAVSGANKLLFDNLCSHISADSKCALLLTIHPQFPKLLMDEDAFRVLGINNLCPALGNNFSSHSYTSQNGHCITGLACPLSLSLPSMHGINFAFSSNLSKMFLSSHLLRSFKLNPPVLLYLLDMLLRPCKILAGTLETSELVGVDWNLASAYVLCPCC